MKLISCNANRPLSEAIADYLAGFGRYGIPFNAVYGPSAPAGIPLSELLSEQEIIDWARQNMAAYKSPRIVEFVEALPKSATGKVMWRALQEKEAAGG